MGTPDRYQPATDPALLRTLAAAGLPATGRFLPKAGWVSRAWVGDEYVVRLSNGKYRDSFRHEATVGQLLAGSEVPHARHLAHGDGPDGPWYISERLPGRTLYEVWPAADSQTRQAMIESLGAALRALHRVPVPAGLLPPWLADALAGKPRDAFHPPVVSAALQQVEAARRLPGHDSRLLADVADWIQERLPLFAADEPVLVHGDLHGSNVIVDQGRVTGLVDFAEALAQPADVELDTILRWCARAREYPPHPKDEGSTKPHSQRSPDGCTARIRNCSSASICASGCSSTTCRGNSRSTHTTPSLTYAKRRRTASLACFPAITIWMDSSGRSSKPRTLHLDRSYDYPVNDRQLRALGLDDFVE